MSSRRGRDVICPFYKDDTPVVIRCEGVTGCVSLHLIFANKAENEKYLRKCCCDKYKTCEVHEMLMRKYE